MSDRVLQDFREMIVSPGGLILVTGPTAHGKTTTLYAAIQTISRTGKKILTEEDPIEFEIPKVNQKQVNANLSFAGYARAFMRQNPDVLMIGEIRDEETANVALNSTVRMAALHSESAFGAEKIFPFPYGEEGEFAPLGMVDEAEPAALPHQPGSRFIP